MRINEFFEVLEFPSRIPSRKSFQSYTCTIPSQSEMTSTARKLEPAYGILLLCQPTILISTSSRMLYARYPFKQQIVPSSSTVSIPETYSFAASFTLSRVASTDSIISFCILSAMMRGIDSAFRNNENRPLAKIGNSAAHPGRI